MKYKPGDVVRVYQKPLTCEDFEGHAKLVKPASEDKDGFQYWKVVFEGDPPSRAFIRKINTDIDVRKTN